MLGLTFNSNLGLQYPQPQITGLMGDAPGTGLTPPANAINPSFQQSAMPFNPQLMSMALGMLGQGQRQLVPQAPMAPMPQTPHPMNLQFPQLSYARFPHGLV